MAPWPTAEPSLRVQALAAMRRTRELLPPLMGKIVAEELDFMSTSGWSGDEARLRQLIAEVRELEERKAA